MRCTSRESIVQDAYSRIKVRVESDDAHFIVTL